ncbi:MAG TPA: sigma factor [Bacteroidia bacterium]|nr:sigma factor [Bacteroidia bacterium]
MSQKLKLVSSKGSCQGSDTIVEHPAKPAIGRESAQAEQRDFVEYLFRRYERPLRRYLSRMTSSGEEVEEVLQEAYIRVMQTDNLDRLEARARGSCRQ